ncbi:MAG: menaquinone biosynthesis family protein [Pyrobaculum sp.]
MLKVAHSPDADDAYMFYGIAAGAVKMPGPHVEFLADIETLNRLALEELLDASAVSVHAYAHLCGKYYVLKVGASMGDGYGPVVVTRGETPRVVAVPGRLTTAALLLRLAMPQVRTVEMPFDKILEAVAVGVVDGGVLIHEGQITFHKMGLRKVIDLGEWWRDETSLPTPLGVNVVRTALGREAAVAIERALEASIRYADQHREEALRYAQRFARGLSLEETARFVDMYVNQYTRDMGARGRRAIDELLQRAFEAGLTPPCTPQFV